MGHIVRNAGWATIDIDTAEGRIFVQQKWLYRWVVQGSLTPWTLAEKRDFHSRADRAIWGGWSGRGRIGVSGASDFARRFAGQTLSINYDINWVMSGQHWTVTVTKIPRNASLRSYVMWNARTISLDTNDIRRRTDINQVPVAHEFGHSVGNVPHLGHGDEYAGARIPSAHSADTRSMLNVGSELRTRHFDATVTELNRMIPGATFAVASVR